MQYFTFRQNNSGGSFIEDKERGLGFAVAVQALNAAHANHRAIDIGIYFNGVAAERDCGCCGDRWCRAYEDDGFDEPGIYESGKFYAGWGISSYIHHIDGTVTVIAEEE